LFFNFYGKYLKDIKIDFLPTGFTSFNDKLIFISPRGKGRRSRSDYCTISVISENGEIQGRLINRNNEKEIDKKEKIGLGAIIYQVYILNNTLHYWEAFYDTIWNISSDFKVTSKNSIYYGKDKLPFKYILESNAKKLTIETLKKYVIPQYFYETNRYMFFELGNKGKMNHIYYDKFSGKSFNLEFKEEVGNRINFSFYNDIDGGLPFWPDGVISEDKVFSVIYGYDLKKYYDEHRNKSAKLITPQNDKILKLINQTKLTDNPIIMIVTLKNK